MPAVAVAIDHPYHLLHQTDVHVVEVSVVLHGVHIEYLLQLWPLIAGIGHLPARSHRSQEDLLAAHPIRQLLSIEDVADIPIAVHHYKLILVEFAGDAPIRKQLVGEGCDERVFGQLLAFVIAGGWVVDVYGTRGVGHSNLGLGDAAHYVDTAVVGYCEVATSGRRQRLQLLPLGGLFEAEPICRSQQLLF